MATTRKKRAVKVQGRHLPSNTKWTGTPLGALAVSKGYTIQSLAEALDLTSLYVRFLVLGSRPLTLGVIQGLHKLGFPLEKLHQIASAR